jgi:hypothetical protein
MLALLEEMRRKKMAAVQRIAAKRALREQLQEEGARALIFPISFCLHIPNLSLGVGMHRISGLF